MLKNFIKKTSFLFSFTGVLSTLYAMKLPEELQKPPLAMAVPSAQNDSVTPVSSGRVAFIMNPSQESGENAPQHRLQSPEAPSLLSPLLRPGIPASAINEFSSTTAATSPQMTQQHPSPASGEKHVSFADS